MSEGLNDFEKLQAKEIAGVVVSEMKEHFVSKEYYATRSSKQDTKIYTIYGILTFFGIGGVLAIINFF